MLDFDYSKNTKLKELGRLVNNDPEDHESWKELLEAVVNQDGRLNRGSDPAEIASTRATFNHFLTLYPLSQEAWLQYAELEFRIAGAEASEYIYERAVGGCGSSVEIWTRYCEHRRTTSHNTRAIRELLERASDSAGHNFYADPIWDAYLLHEQKHGDAATLCEMYKRLIKIPLFHYARYYNDFRGLAAQMSLELLETEDELLQLRSVVQSELKEAGPEDVHAALRAKVDERYWKQFQALQEDVNRRWHWEQHVGKDGGSSLEDATRVSLWNEYLDYEEQNGDYVSIRALHERCLLYNSTHQEFWYRFVRWLTAQPEKEEEARNVYRRASYIFAPIYDSSIRLSWSKFEEAFARPSVAADLLDAVLEGLPDDMPAHSALTMLQRRQYGLESAVASLSARVDDVKVSPSTKGGLIIDWAKLIWRETGDAQAARYIFERYQKPLTDVATFWSGWLAFEIDQPVQQQAKADRARTIYQTMQQMANLPAPELQELSTLYMRYLDERADASSIAELVELDAFVNGPVSLRSTTGTAAPTAVNGKGN